MVPDIPQVTPHDNIGNPKPRRQSLRTNPPCTHHTQGRGKQVPEESSAGKVLNEVSRGLGSNRMRMSFTGNSIQTIAYDRWLRKHKSLNRRIQSVDSLLAEVADCPSFASYRLSRSGVPCRQMSIRTACFECNDLYDSDMNRGYDERICRDRQGSQQL